MHLTIFYVKKKMGGGLFVPLVSVYSSEIGLTVIGAAIKVAPLSSSEESPITWGTSQGCILLVDGAAQAWLSCRNA